MTSCEKKSKARHAGRPQGILGRIILHGAGRQANLELRREIVLYEPELHWSLCVLQDAQYHDLEKALVPARLGLR